MGARFLIDNILSPMQYPNHVVTAEEEAPGFEVTHLANGRRRGDNHWESTTPDNPTWFESKNDRLRGVDMIALDQHNLAGQVVTLQISSDGLTYADEWTVTLPSVSTVGALSDPNGVLTRDGLWIRHFPLVASMCHRVGISAMGPGLVPQIAGCMLGLSFAVDHVDLPLPRQRRHAMVVGQRTPAGWAANQPSGVPRDGEVQFALPSFFAYAVAHPHFEENFATVNRPMVIVLDELAGHEAILSVRTADPVGFARTREAVHGAMTVAWQEHQPVAYP